MDICDAYCISSGTTVHTIATAIKIPATAYITRNRHHQPRQTYDHTRTPHMLTVHRFARTIVRQ